MREGIGRPLKGKINLQKQALAHIAKKTDRYIGIELCCAIPNTKQAAIYTLPFCFILRPVRVEILVLAVICSFVGRSNVAGKIENSLVYHVLDRIIVMLSVRHSKASSSFIDSSFETVARLNIAADPLRFHVLGQSSG